MFPFIPNTIKEPQELLSKIALLADTMQRANYILIGAGAGLLAAAGLSFADELLFAKRYPYWAARGRHSEYHMFSFRDWSEEQQWAYMADHVHRVCYETPPLPLYRTLKTLLEEHLKDKSYQVLTSNVDCQFARNDFPSGKIFEYQGNYQYLCCTQLCTTEVWPFYPVMKEMMAHTTPATAAIPSHLLPRCPHCGAPLRLAFRDYPAYDNEKANYQKWLQQSEQGMLCIIEIGVGFNSPGVIRVPFERITQERSNVKFFRITVDYPNSEEEIAYPEIPVPIADKSCSINADAAFVIETLEKILSASVP